jgi:hypothetical protein
LHSDQGRNFESHLLQKIFNAWEWARRVPHPCNRSQTAWWNATLRRSRSTCGRSSHPTRETGMRGYNFFS